MSKQVVPAETVQQVFDDLSRGRRGLAAVGGHDDGGIVLRRDRDPDEERAAASRAVMQNPPARVPANAPAEREALVRSGERPVQLVVSDWRKQRLPAQQAVEVIGGVEPEIADRAMDRSRRPEGDGKQI